MNYFFALEVPDEARLQIAAFAERWQSQVDPALNARWVAPENYHITLKHLGDISPELVAVSVRRAASYIEQMATWRQENGKTMDKVLIEQKPIVAFPAGKPPVLWIEIVPNELLSSLASSLLLLPDLRWEQREHRPYKPHITLAYCKPETETGPLLLTEQAFVPFAVKRFVLMQTLPPEQRAKDTKSRYNIVQTFPFGNTPS